MEQGGVPWGVFVKNVQTKDLFYQESKRVKSGGTKSLKRMSLAIHSFWTLLVKM